MGEIKSSIGSRKFEGQSFRNLEVPDESGNPQTENREYHFETGSMDNFNDRLQATSDEQSDKNMEREFQAARDARKSGRERMPDGAKRRIEMLLGMTRLYREVDLEGQLYKLQTLKSKEIRESFLACSPFDGTVEFPFEMRKQLLARSLLVVASVEVETLIGSSKLSDKIVFIDELDHALLTRLYSEYTALAQDSQDKYAVKTDQEAVEVITDLKK